MAPAKKNVTVSKEETKPVSKAPVKEETPVAETVKAASDREEAPRAEEVKTEAPKAEKKPAAAKEAPAAKTETVTTATKKPGRKPSAKTAEKKPAEKKTAVKKELKSDITVQFGGKSYTQEELVQIAKDVWKYDLNQKASDLTSIELYVKPEEHVAYYVMNKEFAGSFYL